MTSPHHPEAPRLFGRHEERAAIEEAIASARLGSSRVLVVWGEPGMGKTALLRSAVDLARSHDMEVLSARGVESEAQAPFGGLLELLRPALDELERIPDVQAEALRGALDLGPTHERDRFVIGAATLNVVSARSDRAPLLVVVDDAQWLDDSSLTALLFAARRLVVDPVAVIFAARSGEAPLLEAARLPALSLEGVDHDTAAEIVALHSPVALAADAVERITRATAGNPLAIAELAAAGLQVDAGAPDTPPEAQTTLAAAYARRIAGLPVATQRALALAAADESGWLAEIGGAAQRLGLAVADLQPAERDGLVELSFGVLAWRHPLVRSAAYGAVTGQDRRAIHAALADVLPDGERDRRAWHLAAAALEPDEHVAAGLEEASVRARSRSAYAVAAAAAERAAQLTPDPAGRARRLFVAAEDAWLGGSGERALATLDQALALAPEPALLADIQYLRGQAILRAGDAMTAYEVLVAGAAAVEDVDPGKAVVMLAEATDACVYAGRPEAMLPTARRAQALLTDAAGERERFFASLALGSAMVWNGDGDEGADLLRDAVGVLERSDVLSGDPRSMAAAALAPLWLRESGAYPLVDRAIELARSEGALGALPFALALAGRAAATSDRWGLGRALYEESIALARETGQRLALCAALAWLAAVQARNGESEACEASAGEALELSERHGLGYFRVGALDALAQLALALGRPDAAVQPLRSAQRTLDESGLSDPDLSTVPELIEASVRGADVPDADASLEEFATNVAAKGCPWARARLERCRGLVADAASFEAYFTAALAFHEGTPDLFEQARTQLCFGERLRRAQRRVDAREHLRAALATFEALGAAPWAERTHAELLATGERARRRDPSTIDDLTPQELQVGLLLAGGHTTREAAAKLFLSPKTVEYHLRNTYRKLGIHSREELAAQLGGAPEAMPSVPS